MTDQSSNVTSSSTGKHPQPFASELIPTPCPENHASFLAWLPDGELGCVWFGGSREGQPDVSIYFSRTNPQVADWTEPVKVSHDAARSEQNPVLVSGADGALTVYYTSQDFSAQDTSVVVSRSSTDGGRTWSEAQDVFPEAGTFIRHAPVLTADAVVFPIFSCAALPGRQWRGHADTSAVAVSTDEGSSWRRVDVPGSRGLVHMSVVPRSDGGWLAFFRSRWADVIHRSESSDAITWTRPVPLAVPNNNSSIQVAATSGGRLLMVANPVGAPAGASEGDVAEEADDARHTAPGQPEPLERHAVWGVERLPVSLLVSSDAGMTWQLVADLEDHETVSAAGVSFEGPRGAEMSYPAVVVDDDGDAHVSYSYARQAIKHVHVPASAIDAASSRTSVTTTRS